MPPFPDRVRDRLKHAPIPAFPRLQGKELEVLALSLLLLGAPIPTFPRLQGKELEVLALSQVAR